MKFIDVVIPSYERLELLVSAVKSVLLQTIPVKTIFVIDDNSSFTEVELRAHLTSVGLDDSKVLFYRNEKNQGACFSRNRGINLSSAKFVAFLDDDDTWQENHLETLMNQFIEVPEAVLAYSGKNIINYSKNKIRRSLNIIPKNDQFNAMLGCNYPGSTSSVLVDREAIISIGGFDSSLPAIQDYDMYLRLAKKGSIVTSREYTLNYRDDTALKITNQLDKARRAYQVIMHKYSGSERKKLKKTICIQNLKKSVRYFNVNYFFIFLSDYLKGG
ncbi:MULTISPECIES: glycosyltransferase family 2 protein [Tenebrionibacter/Tenebrionicola group]|uniref:Glycosyltransferase family 2 protein n=2 Tax=Tenebrionibacter/Tenebrionicola group TaxID=2969848 RepID=A0A8K0XZ52_9ENTR|nr:MULTISPECIES: glycosyltransferase family A protein [Tenebrionibacter/Tenebrionicola group]MBK4715234.1 glycosyltransferase family 2 protein [Tenebrionibacter intestinalis]MBV5094173.1 glycosyltransferase family 2 protein [Tenebrionicola larvae]